MQKNNNRIRIKYLIYLICVLGLFIIMGTISATAMRYYSTVSVEVVGYAKENRSTTFNVVFDANGGTGTMSNQSMQYGSPANLSSNAFTRENYTFAGWNTKADGTGTSYNDEDEINITSFLENNTLNLYAKWGQGAVEVNGSYYNTVTEAINANAIPTDGTLTTVNVLRNISDNIKTLQGMNVILDLHNNNITNSTTVAIITNNGILQVQNGSFSFTSIAEGVINNNATGNIKITNLRVELTINNGKQVLYNNNGIAEITGNSYFSTTATSRAPVHNLAYGTLKITGGTIISNGYRAVENLGTLSVGTKDDVVDYNLITIQGKTYGINTTKNFNFYDGIVKGKQDAFNDKNKVGEKEDGYGVRYNEEVIGGQTYKTAYLFSGLTVKFNPMGGTSSESTRVKEPGETVGTLPTCTKVGYLFNGWFTASSGGQQITANTIINDDITFYAQWTKRNVVEMNGTIYATFKEAITAAPNNTQTTLTLLETTAESFTVGSGKNIVIDLQSYTISNSNSSNAVIQNDGTLELINGTITSNSNSASIDNNSTGTLLINGTTITATGQKQALYNDGGIVEITGNAYLSSSASGKRENYDNLERGTVQNLPGGTITITDATIVGNVQHGVSNEGTLILGVKDDGNVSTTSPQIMGNLYGIISTGTLNYYDGIIKGITDTISGTITEQQSNTQIKNDTEIINTKTYKTVELETIP